MSKSKIFAFFVFISVSMSSHAESKSVFGFELGEDFNAVYCKGYTSHPKEGYCIVQNKDKELKNEKDATSGQFTILFKYNDLPFWTGSKITAQLVEGKLEGIIASTGGRTTHISVSQDLLKKYGEPQSIINSEVQNQMGNKFDNNIMLWDLGNISITYIPILGDLKSGKIEFFTKKGRVAHERDIEETIKPPTRGL